MKANEILKTLKRKDVQDYSYAIMFFLVSSFFALFVIRPVLSIAIQIRREGEDLKRINEVYEDNITEMLKLQAQIESLRDRKYLLSEALPSRPDVPQVIQDLQQAGANAQVPLKVIEVNNLVYKSDEGGPSEPIVQARLQAESGFTNIDGLLREIVNQRRIKTVRSMDMIALPSGDSVSVNLVVELDAHYLNQTE